MRRIIRRFLQNSKMITGVLVQMMAAFLFGFTAVELPNYLYFLIWCTGLILCCSVTGTKESKKAFEGNTGRSPDQLYFV